MRRFSTILALISIVIGQTDTTATFSGISGIITIDASDPTVDWISPNGGEQFTVNEIFTGSWNASDESFGTNPIQVDYSTEIGGWFYPVASNMNNSGSDNFSAPASETDYFRIRIQAMDVFGNVAEDISQGYILVGTGAGGSDTTTTISDTGPQITIDAEDPFVEWLLPNGGESYASGEAINISWNSSDQNYGANPIDILISETIGGYTSSIASQIPNTGSTTISLPTVDTQFARLHIIGLDNYGNKSEDASDGYITIGSPAGAGNDTTANVANFSGSFVTDASDPQVDILMPDGGETYLEFSSINVQWSAFDESILTNPIQISMATEIGGIFTLQSENIANDGLEQIVAPAGPVDFGQMRVTAVDTFGNIGVDESAGYFSVFVSGTGAIQGYISTARDIDGTLYVSLWYPGHNPDTDPADEEKTPVSVSMLFSDQYLYSFANIDPGVGYTVGAFIDQNGSTNTGTDICDNGFDLSGLSLPITVETNLVSQGTDIALAECPDFDAPAIPDAFSIAAGDREIILSWTANGEPDLVGYNIYRGLSATTLILVDDITAPDTSYIDTSVINGQEYFYQITARDGATNESDPTAVLSIIPNGPPQWVGITDTSFFEDDSLVLDLYVLVFDDSDADNTLTFTIPSGDSISIIYNEPSHTVTFVAEPDSSGFSDFVTFTATDPQGAFSNLSFLVYVQPVNDSPVITSPSEITAVEESPFSYEAAAYDVESELVDLSYDVVPSWTSVNGVIISGTPDDFASDTIFRVIASDGEMSDTLDVSLWITYINDPPTITSATQVNAVEDQYFVYHGTVDDPDNSSFYWQFSNLPQWVTVNADSVYGIPTEGMGDTSFTCIVSDGDLQDTVEVQVSVQAVNDPPVLISDVVTLATEDLPYQYIIEGFDPENISLNWQFQNIPSWLNADADTLSGIPAEGNLDTTFTIIGQDDANSEQWIVDILVTPVNDPPIITSTNSLSGNSGQYVVYHGSASDPEDSTLFWIFSSLPSWLTADADSVFGLPEPSSTDTFFIAQVSDGELTDEITVSIVLNQGNTLPSVYLADIVEEQHKNVTMNAFLMDQDGDPLTWSVKYNIGDGNWMPCTISSFSGTIGIDTMEIVWDSWNDLPEVSYPAIELRVIAFDNIGINYSESIPFSLDNHVGSAQFQLDTMEEVSRVVELPIMITDYSGDHYTITINYAFNGSGWNTPSLQESSLEIGADQYNTVFHWNSEDNLPNQDGVATMSLAIFDGWEYGQGDTISIPLDNQFLPIVTNLGNMDIHWFDTIELTSTVALNDSLLNQDVAVTGLDLTYPSIPTWDSLHQLVEINNSGGWIGSDIIQVIIPHTITDIYGNPVDGNQNGDPDGAADDVLLEYNVHMIGDYDGMGSIDFEDLVLFQQAWWQDPINTNDNVGPATGVPPYMQVNADSVIDFEDLMVFAQMWNWSNDQSGRVLARGSNFPDGNTININVSYAKRKPGEPDDLVFIDLLLDSLESPPGSWNITLHHTTQDMALQQVESLLDDQWILLKKEDPNLGYIMIQMADLNRHNDPVQGYILRLTYKRLSGVESDIGIYCDVRDRSGYLLHRNYHYQRIQTQRPLPDNYALNQNYPNPFNPTTRIDYDLPEDTQVSIIIYDILGQEILSLVDGEQVAGFHSIVWDGSNHRGQQVSAGMYLMHMATPHYSAVKKLVLVK